MILHKRGEGQWLVPGLCKNSRWDPTKKVDWESVTATWLSRISMVEDLVGKIDVIIEKSPPNIVRAEQLVKAFPNNTLVTFNRNPYASCSSTLYRQHSPEKKTELERISTLRKIAADWVFRTTWIKKWIDTFSVVNFTYEQFCASPRLHIESVIDVLPSLKGIDVSKSFMIKDYPSQGISNQNKRQIGNLSEREKAEIGAELSTHESLLNFFGYTSVWDKLIEEGGANDSS